MAAGAASLAVLMFAGCSGSIAERSYPGMPTGARPMPPTPLPGQVDLPTPDFGPWVQWSDSDRVLAVSLWGSSSCPVEPTSLEQVERDYLSIEVKARKGPFGACTSDLAMNTYEIRVPASVTKTGHVTVRVDGREFILQPSPAAG